MKKIQLKNLFVCDSAIVNGASGNLSIIEMYFEMKTHALPIINPKFTIVTSFVGDQGEYKVRIKIITPDKKNLAYIEKTVQIKRPSGAGNLIGTFINVPFQIEGIYLIEVLVEDEKVSSDDSHYISVIKN